MGVQQEIQHSVQNFILPQDRRLQTQALISCQKNVIPQRQQPNHQNFGPITTFKLKVHHAHRLFITPQKPITKTKILHLMQLISRRSAHLKQKLIETVCIYM